MDNKNTEELYEMAKLLQIPGRSNMKKQDLIDAIKKAEKRFEHHHDIKSTYGDKVVTDGFFDANKLTHIYNDEIDDHQGCRICARNRAQRSIHSLAKTQHIIESLEHKSSNDLTEHQKQTLKIAKRNENELKDFIKKTVKKYKLQNVVELKE